MVILQKKRNIVYNVSKIGNKPVTIGDSTEVTIGVGLVEVKGKEGRLTIPYPDSLVVKKDGSTITVERLSEDRKIRAVHGLIRSLISNAVVGVSTPWEKNLEVVGTGYKVKLQGEDLVFDVGYSHSVVFKKMAGLSYQVEGTNKVTIKGIDKQLVGQAAHKIKIIKKPDPYKGKGVRYQGEVIKLKPGKKAKTVGAATK